MATVSVLDERAERTAQVRDRYRQFVLSHWPAGRSLVRVAIGILLLCSLILIPIGIWLVITGLMKRTRRKEQLEAELAFIDRAECVMAFPIMVNSLLREPGERPVPGLFVMSFDDGPPQTLEFMAEVILAMEDIDSAKVSPDDARFLTELLLDEEYQRSRRRKLPVSITAGHTIYACDIAVNPLYLPNRHLADEFPLVPCLAEPRDHGQIRPIPYWCAADALPPAWAARCGVFVA